MNNNVTEINNYIIKKLAEVSQEHQDIIELFGVFGSLKCDIDSILILKTGLNDSNCLKKLEPVMLGFMKLSKELNKKYPFTIFPSFRLQTWLESTTLPGGQPMIPRRHYSVHLLTYPSVKSFFEWERPFLITTLLKTLRPILGSDKKIIEGSQSIKFPPLVERLQYYKNILFETYQLFYAGRISDESIRVEMLQKIKYILKFSSLEFLHGNGYEYDSYGELQIIKKDLEGTFGQRIPLFDVVDEMTSTSLSTIPERSKMLIVFYELNDFIGDLLTKSVLPNSHA